MIKKRYFGDGLIQIAILLSLLRTDLNNLAVPNNEILNYPEVQDILQGQTLAISPTSFHNQYNSLHGLHGAHNPKHIEEHIDNGFFSSLFNNWRFRRLSTNIEAFLVRCDETIGLPPAQQPPEQGTADPPAAHVQPLDADAENNNNNNNDSPDAEADSATASAEAAHFGVDASGGGSIVAEDDFCHPFPGLCLSREDLDLIEVLWRQDVDLGVGKEVFDPNLRKEIEQERELELRKEQEKRKEAERRERERQQQAQQWLSQNFIRDGETGELMPIAGNNSNGLAPSGHNGSLYPEVNFPSTLEEALNFVGELQANHTYGQQAPQLPEHQQQQQQQQPAVAAAGSHSGQPLNPFDTEELQYLTENFIEGVCGGHNYTATNQTEQERLEQSWKEVVESIFPTPTTTTPTATATSPTATATITSPPYNSNSLHLNITSNGTLAPPVEEPQPLPPLPSPTDSSFLHELPHFFQGTGAAAAAAATAPHAGSMDFMLPESNQSMSSAASISATRRLLHQNSSDMSELAGLLQNATLPVLPALSALDMQSFMASDPGLADMVNPDYNTVAHPSSINNINNNNDNNSPQDLLSHLDLESADLLFTGAGDLTNMAGVMMGPADLLNSSDLLSILPVGELDMAMDEGGLDSIQIMDETASDSAISMGSGSPQQEINETMQMSPFDGLEGATGGSDYDNGTTTTYRSHMHSSGSTEEENYQYSCSSYGSPASVSTNSSTGSNDTEHSTGPSSNSPTALHHIHHNHTYPTQPGQTPREVKKYAKKDGPRQKGPQSRDNKRAEDLKLPFTFEQIVSSPVEEFNELLTKTKLTEAQVNLMRDIRRRGKNKVAAQNCRKRKLDVLVSLEDDMATMQRTRDKLAEERREIERQTRQAKDRYNALYDHIFDSLRDERGLPYDPTQFSLQESSDGNVFLVRRVTGSATSPASASSSSTASSSSGYPPSHGGPSSSSSLSSSLSSSSSSSGSSGISSGSGSKRGKDSDPRKDSSSFPPQKKKSRE